jgi:hypothetical protein
MCSPLSINIFIIILFLGSMSYLSKRIALNTVIIFVVLDKQESLNHVSTSKQKSTSIASNSTSSGDVASPSRRDTSPANSRMVPSSLSYTLGHMGAGSPAIAAAASQAIVATQQVILQCL